MCLGRNKECLGKTKEHNRDVRKNSEFTKPLEHHLELYCSKRDARIS